jgi:hypothetical protein
LEPRMAEVRREVDGSVLEVDVNRTSNTPIGPRCTRCGDPCSGYCSIGLKVVCAECFKYAVIVWMANYGTTSGV